MTTQAIEKNGKAPLTLKAFLESPQAKAKLAEVATRHLRPEDLIRLALMAASRQPELMRCSHTSILRALLDAAAMGVAPGGVMGRGWIVPRKNRHTGELEACFDPGWRGLIDIARRSGAVKSIEAVAVYEADEFSIELGDEGKIVHRPALDVEDRGEVVAAYAVATFTDGSKQREFLTRADLNKIRNTSMAKSGPWKDWGEEMARKSAVRRLAKYLPYDPVLDRALEHATDVESGVRTVVDTTAAEKQPRAKALASAIKAKADAQDAEAAPANEPPIDFAAPEERQPGED